ncbi:MAG TPA: hypothetical protein VHX17_05680 [Candidatus Cybelea sp.]|nr:hypothetical protein [Candidatus Cybelea sp.]
MIYLRCVRGLGITAGFVLLAGCGASQPMASAQTTDEQPVARSSGQSLQEYYLTKFTTLVGSNLPESTFCLRFRSSGHWSNIGSEDFKGTYLKAGKHLFAFGTWPASPDVFLSLQGSVNPKRGSGTFMISGFTGYASGGGTYVMTGKQNKTCS